jgi:cytochrome c7-like protein/class III cytochrome C family protein
MPQVFHRSTNTLSRLSIFGGLFAVAALAWGLALVNRSAYVTWAGVARQQPVPFSHRHHAGELGIDCRYCHTTVERSAVAGIPPTKTCMNCHSQIWVDSPMLEPVRASFRTDRSIEWIKVHDLPDFVYFNHSIHVRQGIGCVSCHGRIDRMNLTWQAASLQMEWCLNCHRQPEQYVRPREEVFNMEWKPPSDQAALGSKLVAEYHIQKQQLTNCSICHR